MSCNALLICHDVAVLQFYFQKSKGVGIYGTGDKSVALRNGCTPVSIFKSESVFVNHSNKIKSYSLSESPVYYFTLDQFCILCEKYNINGIIFPSYEMLRRNGAFGEILSG